MSSDQELAVNAVRMAIQTCRETEEAIRRDFAYQEVFGTPQAAREQQELLALASESTAQYVRLLGRMESMLSQLGAAE